MGPADLHVGHYKPDWGDVPTWAAVVLTLVAGWVAYRAFVVSKRAYKVAHEIYQIESQRDQEAAGERRARDDAQRRAQADKIAAWFIAEGDRNLNAIVKNSSDLPIFDAVVYFYYVGDTEEFTEATFVTESYEWIRVVPPGTERPSSGHNSEGGTVLPHESEYVVAIEFRDAAGVRWERDAHGKLTELPSAT